MNFFVRFFVGYALVAALGVLLAMKLFTDQLVPGVRQSVEETLLQTANLLAETAEDTAVCQRVINVQLKPLWPLLFSPCR